MTRSMTLARFGKTSLIFRPGTAVSIGLNSPRTSAGGVGLGVERVEVRRPARQPDQDAVLALAFAAVPRPGSRRPGPGAGTGRRGPARGTPSEPDPQQLRDGSGRGTPWLFDSMAGTWSRPAPSRMGIAHRSQWLNANSREFSSAQNRSSAASRRDEACFSSADQSRELLGGRRPADGPIVEVLDDLLGLGLELQSRLAR